MPPIQTPPGFEPWQPGHTGKGLWFSNGKLMLWKTVPDGGTDAAWMGAPHHGAAYKTLNIPYDGKRVQNELVMGEDGRVEGLSGAPHGVEQIDPRLTPVDTLDDSPGAWKFASSVNPIVPKGFQMPTPGQPYKGMKLRNGDEYAWAINEQGEPHHGDIMGTLGIKGYRDVEQYYASEAKYFPKPDWDFTSKVVEHKLDWIPAEHGRAVVDQDGAVHTWIGGPNHAEYASRQAVKPRSYYFISPSGTLTPGAKTYPHDDVVVKELLHAS